MLKYNNNKNNIKKQKNKKNKNNKNKYTYVLNKEKCNAMP